MSRIGMVEEKTKSVYMARTVVLHGASSEDSATYKYTLNNGSWMNVALFMTHLGTLLDLFPFSFFPSLIEACLFPCFCDSCGHRPASTLLTTMALEARRRKKKTC